MNDGEIFLISSFENAQRAPAKGKTHGLSHLKKALPQDGFLNSLPLQYFRRMDRKTRLYWSHMSPDFGDYCLHH